MNRKSVADRGSGIVGGLERAWGLIREVQPCLPPVVIVLLDAGHRRKWGHFAGWRWRAGRGSGGHEVAINPALLDSAEGLLGTLLHEAAHALLFEWGLNSGVGPDGYYHREEFRSVCRKLGLECSFRNRRYGWSQTGWPSGRVPAQYARVLVLLRRELPWGLRGLKQQLSD